MTNSMAGRYPQEWLEELRQRADIVSVIGSYVQLKKNGHRYVGLCPFHNEKSPSFYVDGQKQVYHCFGCKAGGSVIQFVMDIERLTCRNCKMTLPTKNAVRSRSASIWPTRQPQDCIISIYGRRTVRTF